jgi:hypothetical protein
MKNFKGTPGPWKHDTDFELYEKDFYSKIDGGIGYLDDKNPNTGFSITGCISDSNAKLIATAPELLEALENLYNNVFEDGTWNHKSAMAEAYRVIIKATES